MYRYFKWSLLLRPSKEVGMCIYRFKDLILNMTVLEEINSTLKPTGSDTQINAEPKNTSKMRRPFGGVFPVPIYSIFTR
jgi:hypothetical protein